MPEVLLFSSPRIILKKICIFIYRLFMDLGHSWLFVVLLANNPICILFFKLNVRNVKCFPSGCSVLHSSSKSNLIYVNCPISLATSFLDETSLLRSLSVLERGKIKSPPTLVLPLGNCSSILDLCLRSSLAGKSRGHRDVIILENFSFKNVFVHTKAGSECFQILPFKRLLLESSVFVMD